MQSTLENMARDLALKGYVKKTQSQYLKTAGALMAHFGRPAAEIGRDELRQWVDELKACSSASKRHAVLCAILFLYRKTLGLPELVSFISLPKRHSPLPTVLSMKEVDETLYEPIAPSLKARHRLSSAQRRVLTDIAQCRTETLGGHQENCTACGYERVVYLSCRNRHCPKCQGLAQEQWIEEQRQRTLNVKHFHVVFTLPAELRPLAAFAQRVMYGLLFQVVGRTLLEFGNENLKATLGATLVLHTWTKALEYHPHVHAIVTAGGLSLDNE